jgi:hypothetical protein
MQQRAVIGEQEQPGRLLVEPADGRERRVAPAPALRQQRIDERAGLLVRAGDAHRLVQHQRQPGWRIDRLAAHAHALRQVGRDGDAALGIGDAGAVERDQPVARQRLHLAPRAVAEIGEQPIEPHRLGAGLAHLRASNTL